MRPLEKNEMMNLMPNCWLTENDHFCPCRFFWVKCEDLYSRVNSNFYFSQTCHSLNSWLRFYKNMSLDSCKSLTFLCFGVLFNTKQVPPSPLPLFWLWSCLSCLLFPHVLTNVRSSSFFFSVCVLSIFIFTLSSQLPHPFTWSLLLFVFLNSFHTCAHLPDCHWPQASSFLCSCCEESWSTSDARTRLCSTGPWRSHASWVSQMSSCQVRRPPLCNGYREEEGETRGQMAHGNEKWGRSQVLVRDEWGEGLEKKERRRVEENSSKFIQESRLITLRKLLW